MNDELHVGVFLVFSKLKRLFKSTSEKLFLVYIVHPTFPKTGARTSTVVLIKRFSFKEKVKNRRTCCAKLCIPYEEVKGLFRKALLNKNLFKPCKMRSNNSEIR